MPTPGVRTPRPVMQPCCASMTTSRVMGCFRDDERSRKEVLSLMGY